MRDEQFLQLGLHCLLKQSSGTDPEQFRQRVRICCSTCELDHVTLFHGGVSPVLIDLFGDNKSTRYAAFFQTLKHQIQLYLGADAVIQPGEYGRELHQAVSVWVLLPGCL
jgi:hypothetical protein